MMKGNRLPMALLATALIFTACKKDEEEDVVPTPQPDPVAVQIAEVRTATAAFVSFSAAEEAGWNNDLSGCVEHPTDGGMGHHIARMEYIDGRVNHLEPQILLFVPDADGNMEFLGVEYIVPFAILSEDEEAPKLFGQAFHKNPNQEIWALHVWTQKANPSGMFADWNPDVSCP